VRTVETNHVFLPSDAIEKLPFVNRPEVCGLHSNAEIGHYTQAAKELWDHLLELQPQTGEQAILDAAISQVFSA
jgi:hypothetical protein